MTTTSPSEARRAMAPLAALLAGYLLFVAGPVLFCALLFTGRFGVIDLLGPALAWLAALAISLVTITSEETLLQSHGYFQLRTLASGVGFLVAYAVVAATLGVTMLATLHWARPPGTEPPHSDAVPLFAGVLMGMLTLFAMAVILAMIGRALYGLLRLVQGRPIALRKRS